MEDVVVIMERLESFLADVEPDVRNVSVSNYEPVIGGYSRVMGRFDLNWNRGGVEESRQLVLRSDPPAGRPGSATDRRTEWELMSWLSTQRTVPVPAPRWYCDDGRLGTPSLVMDYVPSASLLAHLRDYSDLSEPTRRLAEVAAGIHGADLGDLPARVVHPGDSAAYLDARIGAWSAMERTHPEADPFLRYVGAWLAAHRPPAVPLTLIHGDFQSANILVCPSGEWVVVDWEFARIGDPREDLGYFRGVASVAPPDVIGNDPEGFCAWYREETGLTEEQINPGVISYFTILGMTTILGQIYDQKAALAQGAAPSINGYYVVGAISYAHMQQLGITELLEEA